MYPTEEQKQTEMFGVYESIEKRIKRLEAITGNLNKMAEKAAHAIANYDKAIAIATAKLALGTVKEVLGVPVNGKPPATLIKKLAEGMCYEERTQQEIAINGYRSIITKIKVLTATLNGKQSLFRNLQ